MIPVENITDWRGQDVVDPIGEKLGKLEEVYFDGETDEPAFAAVKTGLVSKRLTLVPLRAGERRAATTCAWTARKAEFKKAPSFDTDVELTLDDEAETYGTTRWTTRPRARAPAASPSASSGGSR